MMRSIFVVCSILLILAPSRVEAQATTIAVRSQAVVVSDVVRLGDVADIASNGSGEGVEGLSSIVICSAPPPAEMQVLGINTIASVLRASGVDPSRLKFEGSAQVFVTREHDLVTVEELDRAFSGHVCDQTGWSRDSLYVKPPKNLHPTPVPVGERSIIVATSPDEDFRGSVFARFQIMVDGKPYRTLAHRFEVERRVEALVTTRKIPRGKLVRASDVELTKVEQSSVGDEPLTSVEQVVGLLARQTIQSGRALSVDMLTSPPVVRRGEFASVVRKGNGFQIMTQGRVLEDGGAGEIVRVRLSSRKIVRAMVLDSRTLRIVSQGE